MQSQNFLKYILIMICVLQFLCDLFLDLFINPTILCLAKMTKQSQKCHFATFGHYMYKYKV